MVLEEKSHLLEFVPLLGEFFYNSFNSYYYLFIYFIYYLGSMAKNERYRSNF